jgi:hypothetical protein
VIDRDMLDVRTAVASHRILRRFALWACGSETFLRVR